MPKHKGKKAYSKMASVKEKMAPDHLPKGRRKKGRSKKSR